MLRVQEKNIPLKGVQNKPPQNVPLRHVGYFKLKKIKAQKNPEKKFLFPLNYLK